MQPSLPKISVITVVRNSAASIERAIQSLLSQHYPNTEYLVLDAASTDGTLDIIKKYEQHITFFRSHKDDGPSAALNEGILRAKGDIISILNADDWYEPGILMDVGEAFIAHPDAEMITTEARVWKKNAQGGMDLQRAFTGKSLEVTPNASPIPNARFYTKKLLETHGDFQLYTRSGARIIGSDLEHLLRLSQYPIRNHIMAINGYNYLMHADSLTMGGNPQREKAMYRERAEVALQYLEKGTLKAHETRLKRWHLRGTTRDFFWRLQDKDRKKAMAVAREGLKINGLRWLFEALRVGAFRRYRL